MNCTRCDLVFPPLTTFCTNCRMYVPNEQPKLGQLAWMPLLLIGTPGIFGIILILFGRGNENSTYFIGSLATFLWTGYMVYHLYDTVINGLFFKCGNCRSSGIVPIHICPRCGEMNVRTKLDKHTQGMIGGIVIVWLAVLMDLYFLSEVKDYNFLRDLCFLAAILVTGLLAVPLFYKLGEYRTRANELEQYVREGHFHDHQAGSGPQEEEEEESSSEPNEH